MLDHKMSSSVKLKANPLVLAFIVGFSICLVVWYSGMTQSPKPKVNMKELLCAGIYVARLGGDAVKKIREEGILNQEVKGLTIEGAQELKSDGDMKSHNIMYYGLKRGFPFIHVRQTVEHTTTAITSKMFS